MPAVHVLTEMDNDNNITLRRCGDYSNAIEKIGLLYERAAHISFATGRLTDLPTY